MKNDVNFNLKRKKTLTDIGQRQIFNCSVVKNCASHYNKVVLSFQGDQIGQLFANWANFQGRF